MNVLELVLAAVVGIVGLVIYGSIRGALNTATLGADVVNIIAIIPLVLAAGIVIGILVRAFMP